LGTHRQHEDKHGTHREYEDKQKKKQGRKGETEREGGEGKHDEERQRARREQERDRKRMGANLALEALFQSENSRMNCILKLNIIIVALLQKSLGIDLLPVKSRCQQQNLLAK